MDNFGEVIYILIFAIIIIKGLFDSFQKRTAQKEEPLPSFDPQQTPKEPNILRDLRKMLDAEDIKEEEEEEKKEKGNPILITSTDNCNQNDCFEEEKADAVIHPNIRTVEKRIPKKEIKMQKQESIRELIKLKDTNDLKRAVIYSEILKRKY